MELEDYWEPGLPMAPGALDQADKQQLLWGFPEILWTAGSVLAFILDLNTRIFVYLKLTYYPTGNDLSTMINKNLATRTGDMNNRFRALIEDATP